MIIEDLENEVKNDKASEASSQTDSEKALDAAKTLKQQLLDKKDELGDIIAKRNVQKIDETEDKTANTADLKDETDYKAEITPDCDWILGAFEGRAAAAPRRCRASPAPRST